MPQKTFFLSTAFLLTVVGALHLIRAVAGWEITVAGSAVIPLWLSWILAPIAGFLAYHAWKFGARCR